MHDEDFTTGNFQTGSTASISTTAVQLVTAANVTVPCRQGVTIRSTTANTVEVQVGKSTVTAGVAAATTDGFVLAPGEKEFFATRDPSSIYLRTASGTVSVTWKIE